MNDCRIPRETALEFVVSHKTRIARAELVAIRLDSVYPAIVSVEVN